MIWSGEDDIADTILPRFVVAGGDRKRVHFVDHVVVDGLKRSFDPSSDIAILGNAIEQIPELTAIMIDPIVAAPPSGSDSHKTQKRAVAFSPR